MRKLFIKKSTDRSDFELAFSELKAIGAKRAYELLSELKKSTSAAAGELISELNKIKYASNTNGVFYFYFPIVSHILFFKPELEKEILGLIIGPNFANGEAEADKMIRVIQGAAVRKLKENPKYLTQESKLWIQNSLPEMHQEVEREIELCWKGLKE